MPAFSISEQGYLVRRWNPVRALEDVAARRRAVIQALEILHPVVRPLALEITFGAMDPETYAVAPETSRRLALRTIPAGVAHRSAFETPAEVELVDAFTPDVVLQAITPDHAGWDVCTVQALVTAARTSARELRVDRAPSVHVPTLELERATWVVGPIDVPGYRLLPPIGLSWRQEWGQLQMTIEAFWSLWWGTTSVEDAALRGAERALDDAGFAIAP